MGAGGIINQRAAVLIPAVSDPSFFDALDASDKARCTGIVNKGSLACDEGDVRYMASLLKFVAYHC